MNVDRLNFLIQKLNCPGIVLYFSVIDNWRYDQFKWEHFGRKLLKTEPVICKTYFNYMTGKGVQKEFKRYAYTICDRASNLTLIHYKGDDSIVNENPHVRTCGSVLRELENSTQSPSVVYKKKIVDCSCQDYYYSFIIHYSHIMYHVIPEHMFKKINHIIQSLLVVNVCVTV